MIQNDLIWILAGRLYTSRRPIRERNSWYKLNYCELAWTIVKRTESRKNTVWVYHNNDCSWLYDWSSWNIFWEEQHLISGEKNIPWSSFVLLLRSELISNYICRPTLGKNFGSSQWRLFTEPGFETFKSYEFWVEFSPSTKSEFLTALLSKKDLNVSIMKSSLFLKIGYFWSLKYLTKRINSYVWRVSNTYQHFSVGESDKF